MADEDPEGVQAANADISPEEWRRRREALAEKLALQRERSGPA